MGKDGRPTEASLKRLLAVLSIEAGKGTRVVGAYIKNDDVAGMLKYANDRLRLNSDSTREKYKLFTNNCITFVKETLEAGGIDTPVMLIAHPNSYIEELQDSLGEASFPLSLDRSTISEKARR